MVDFIAEWTEAHAKPAAVDLEYWSMYFNSSLMLQGAGAEVVLVSPSGNLMRYVLLLNFEGATNNVVEYEALLHELRVVLPLGVRRLVALGELELVVSQVMKASACRDHKMEA